MQKSIDVCAGQNGRAGWHAEHGNAVAKLDVCIDQALEQAFDEGIDRLAGLGREHGNPFRQAVIERDACRHVLLRKTSLGSHGRRALSMQDRLKTWLLS